MTTSSKMCACGCGMPLPPGQSHSRERRFIHGHHLHTDPTATGARFYRTAPAPPAPPAPDLRCRKGHCLWPGATPAGTRQAFRFIERGIGRRLDRFEQQYLGWSEPFHELAWRLSHGKLVALQAPDLVLQLDTVGDVQRWLEDGLSAGRVPPPVDLPKLTWNQRQAIHSYVRKLQRQTQPADA